MLPFLSPLSANSLAGGVVQVPAPPNFKGVRGLASRVEIGGPSFISKGKTSAQKAGLRYEAKVQAFLRELFPAYQPSPYVRFMDERGSRVCIPDGLLTFEYKRAVIFEIKYTHTPDAWWQLKRLYEPVLKAAGFEEVQTIEVCKTYDPTTPFPCKVELLEEENLRRFALTESPAFGVFPWNR